MYQFKNIMVGLDLTEMDNTLVSYTAFIAKLIKPERIYFINIQHELNLSENVKDALGIKDTPMDEYCEKEMKKTVEAHFSDAFNFDIEYEVVEGNPANEIIEWTNIKDVDLLVLGRKQEMGGSGVMPQQISSKVMASLLFVPEKHTNFKMERLFVPIDFSSNSKMALEEAVMIDKQDKGNQNIVCQYVYKLPTGYYSTGKTEEEFVEIMETNARNDYNKFIAGFEDDLSQVKVLYTYSDGKAISEVVNKHAHNEKADLIVMGAKGRTLASSILLGSTTSKLIYVDSDIPLLVVKDKEKTFNFWEMLKKI